MVAQVPTLILQDLLPEEATGVARYCGALLAQYRMRGLPFRVKTLAARPFRIGGLSFGYFMRIAWHRLTVRPRGLVHSLFWYVIPPATKIVTVYDIFSLPDRHPHPLSRWLYGNVRRDLVEKPEAWVAISQSVRQQLSERLGVPKNRTFVARPGIDIDTFKPGVGPRPAAMPRDGKTNVLHVGHGYGRKGIHLLVEALGRLGAPRFRLVRVGPRRDPEYIARYTSRAAKLGLEVVECGFVPDGLLPAYYGNADVFAFPSLDEGAGIPPLEAMACGTNVVVSDLPAHREVCGNQAFYAGGEVDTLAGAIREAIEHPRPPTSLRAHAQRFSWAETANTYLELYSRIGGAETSPALRG